MDTRLRGDSAEAAVLHAFTSAGLYVWLPWSRFGKCDLIVENRAGAIARAQVKLGRVRDRCVVANSRSTDHGAGRRTYLGQVDILVVDVPEIDERFVIPIAEACGYGVRLRRDQARNNQRSGVKFAVNYDLRKWAGTFSGGARSIH